MLNIGRLAPGGEGYYLATVASGVEDYYTGSGEAPGYWMGAASGDLRLHGRVEPETLRAVLGATDPTSDQRLIGNKSRRTVPGFDCTFRPPKSVSVLYGLGDTTTSAEVRDAHDTAVAAAVGYLERCAAFSRRGRGGTERVGATGLVAAAFRHRTSRAGDPLLHSHVLVANLARGRDDGQWRTLDSRSLYRHAKTAGYLYQAQLRVELTRRLGVQWQPVRRGYADIAGIPDEVIREFSRRRADIEAHMTRRGQWSARAAQVATLATRRAKKRHVEPAALGADWITRAAALGYGPDDLQALVTGPTDVLLTADTIVHITAELAGPHGLTAHASTFNQRDILQSWCDRLPAGADVKDILALAEATTSDGHDHGIVRLPHLGYDDVGVGDREEEAPRYSTAELLALERRLITRSAARRSAKVAQARPDALRTALAQRPTLTAEQAAMVRGLTTSGAGVEVVVGKAGAGKTFALAAAAQAWQDSGIPVVGCALAARAARELQDGAGIPSSTLDSLLTDLDRAGPHGGLAPGSVVVVDEAGMVGTRDLARLLAHADRHNAKVVLVGDHHQLPEIAAGGAFRGLVARLPAIELTENRRQHEPWEREALDELRAGNAAAALPAYDAAGRITVGDDRDDTLRRLIDDWWHAQADDPQPGHRGVILAARITDVDDLNALARARMDASDLLTGPTLETADGRQFRIGDRVMCLRNNRGLGVSNGDRGTVTAIDTDMQEVRIRLDSRPHDIELPKRYLDAGHLTHAYAITAHKSQGMTTEQTWILGGDTIYREWGYVALSRGTHGNHLYIVAAGDDDVEHRSAQQEAGSPQASLQAALSRSAAQRMAIDQTLDRDETTSPPPRSRPSRSHRSAHPHDDASERTAAIAGLRRRLDEIDRTLATRRGLRRLRGRDEAATLRRERTRLRGDLREWLDEDQRHDPVAESRAHERAGLTVSPAGRSTPTADPVDNSKFEMQPPRRQADDRGVGLC